MAVHKCSKCSYSSRRKANLVRHYKNMHERESAIILSKCSVCALYTSNIIEHSNRYHASHNTRFRVVRSAFNGRVSIYRIRFTEAEGLETDHLFEVLETQAVQLLQWQLNSFSAFRVQFYIRSAVVAPSTDAASRTDAVHEGHTSSAYWTLSRSQNVHDIV